MRRLLVVCICVFLFSCDTDENDPQSRTWRMGFQNSAPRYDDINLFLRSLDLWIPRADAAIISVEVPWKELLAGEKAADHVVANYKDLAAYYKSKDLVLWVYIDPQNGLDRTSDAVSLVDLGKSIADADMQVVYQKFVVAMDSILKPVHLGLALETNLIRDAALPPIYNGVRQAANDAAALLKSRNSPAKLSVSVQVDHAWGKLVGGSYKGVSQDYLDFPFMEEVGLSSYPYFGFDKPQDIPPDYYSKLLEGKGLPSFVSEGGWTSETIDAPGGTRVSSEQLQKEYIEHHGKLLDQARCIALFQLTFTDIDVNSLPPDVPENLPYFAFLGLVDAAFNPKPALEAWDVFFHRPLE